jgi:hypothetical protein
VSRDNGDPLRASRHWSARAGKFEGRGSLGDDEESGKAQCRKLLEQDAPEAILDHGGHVAYAFIASLILGLVMTLGDFAWAAFQIRHRVLYGVIHGAVMCLCVGLAVGVRARRPLPAAAAGPAIGVAAAALFYALAPALRWGALFPAWMLLWLLFALLQERFDRKERLAGALGRGIAAALLSGAAFYLVSGMWTGGSHADPNLPRRFASWSFAFLPGFLALFVGRRSR